MKQDPRLSYSAFLREAHGGQCFGVFIDDTGSPGLRTVALDPERRSWVAVLVPPTHMREVVQEMPPAVDRFRSLTGAKEFHFADIYGGRGPYANLTVQQRLGVFRFFADIFSRLQLNAIIQTFDRDDLARVRASAPFPDRWGPFNLKKPSDAALLFLLVKVKQFLAEHRQRPETRAWVFADEGFKKSGIALPLPPFEDVLVRGAVLFACSDDIVQIQLADFIAFAINRQLLMMARGGPPSELELELSDILEPIADLVDGTVQVRVDWEKLLEGPRH